MTFLVYDTYVNAASFEPIGSLAADGTFSTNITSPAVFALNPWTDVVQPNVYANVQITSAAGGCVLGSALDDALSCAGTDATAFLIGEARTVSYNGKAAWEFWYLNPDFLWYKKSGSTGISSNQEDPRARGESLRIFGFAA